MIEDSDQLRKEISRLTAERDAFGQMTRENVLAAVKDRNDLIALLKECEEEIVWCEAHWGADYGDLIERIRAAVGKDGGR